MLSRNEPTSVLAGQGPLVAIVFFGFLAVGTPIAALSLEVSHELGYGSLIVGVVIGLQSAVTVIFRHQGGTLCDQAGPRRAVLLGLPLAALSGVFYLGASAIALAPAASLILILLGRVVMGIGEALFITGTLSWGIARLGPARTGIVMSWQGIAMFVALGAGAPLGLNAYRLLGFPAVALPTIAMPLLALAIACRLPAAAGTGGERVPFYRVLGLIWRPGLVLGLATAPFASITAFVALDYHAHGWAGAGAAIAAFGIGYVAVRAFFSHLPDKHGGAPVASVSLLAEAVGQTLLWLAPSPPMAFAGACLTGAGFSLIFPSMGLEATRRVSSQQRGRAVGNFTAFFDLAIGFTGPAVGFVAGRFGYPSAFLIGTACALLGLVFLIGLRRQPSAAA